MKKIILCLFLFTINGFSQNFNYRNYSLFLSKYVSNTGNVNYDKIKANKPKLDAIIAQFDKIQPTDKWLKNEKMAYYINAYNIYTIKVIIDNYPTKNIKDINGAWSKKIVTSGKSMISLKDVENKILRKMDDPRIHFAINCASYSCPNLANIAYVPATLEKQLEKATKSFINDKSKNAITENEINISKIFDWFEKDFKTSGTLIDFLNKYSKVKIDPKAKIKFLEYDWALNK